MFLDVMWAMKVVVEFKGGSVLGMTLVGGTKFRGVDWGRSILSTWRRWQWQFGRDWGRCFLGGGHVVEEADSELKDGKDCWGVYSYIVHRQTRKFVARSWMIVLYIGDLGCSGPQEVALRVLPCLVPEPHSPSIKHCVSEYQTSL
jgi:hypothetical protein